MKPLEKPPEYEGDDSINTPEGTKEVAEKDLKNTRVLKDKDKDDESDS